MLPGVRRASVTKALNASAGLAGGYITAYGIAGITCNRGKYYRPISTAVLPPEQCVGCHPGGDVAVSTKQILPEECLGEEIQEKYVDIPSPPSSASAQTLAPAASVAPTPTADDQHVSLPLASVNGNAHSVADTAAVTPLPPEGESDTVCDSIANKGAISAEKAVPGVDITRIILPGSGPRDTGGSVRWPMAPAAVLTQSDDYIEDDHGTARKGCWESVESVSCMESPVLLPAAVVADSSELEELPSCGAMSCFVAVESADVNSARTSHQMSVTPSFASDGLQAEWEGLCGRFQCCLCMDVLAAPIVLNCRCNYSYCAECLGRHLAALQPETPLSHLGLGLGAKAAYCPHCREEFSGSGAFVRQLDCVITEEVDGLMRRLSISTESSPSSSGTRGTAQNPSGTGSDEETRPLSDSERQLQEAYAEWRRRRETYFRPQPAPVPEARYARMNLYQYMYIVGSEVADEVIQFAEEAAREVVASPATQCVLCFSALVLAGVALQSPVQAGMDISSGRQRRENSSR
jgi:hypothetical protein